MPVFRCGYFPGFWTLLVAPWGWEEIPPFPRTSLSATRVKGKELSLPQKHWVLAVAKARDFDSSV